MSDSRRHPCAHIPCRCMALANEKYCSQACERVGFKAFAGECLCNHATCLRAAYEEAVLIATAKNLKLGKQVQQAKDLE
jgi:hypothetical protein